MEEIVSVCRKSRMNLGSLDPQPAPVLTVATLSCATVPGNGVSVLLLIINYLFFKQFFFYIQCVGMGFGWLAWLDCLACLACFSVDGWVAFCGWWVCIGHFCLFVGGGR